MTLVVKMHWSHYSFHPPEDSKHPQEAAEGSFSRAEPPAQTARAFIANRLSLCGISSRERNLSQPLEPGWFQRDSERSKPNLLSLGESIPEECASSSSPVLIVNHVTEKKTLMMFGLLVRWLPIKGFYSPSMSSRVWGWDFLPHSALLSSESRD